MPRRRAIDWGSARVAAVAACVFSAIVLAADLPPRARAHRPPLVGSYAGSLLTNSVAANLSSDADVPATVAALERTSHSIVGMAVDQCRDFELLRPMLAATAGAGISVFGVLGSHNGPIYCDAVYGNFDIIFRPFSTQFHMLFPRSC